MDFDITYYLSYTIPMKHFEWSEEKNARLKSQRGVSFEAVLTAIGDGKILAEQTHPRTATYPNQRIIIVQIEDYAYVVPYVTKDETTLFLKTIIPSRKATRHYLRGGNAT